MDVKTEEGVKRVKCVKNEGFKQTNIRSNQCNKDKEDRPLDKTISQIMTVEELTEWANQGRMQSPAMKPGREL